MGILGVLRIRAQFTILPAIKRADVSVEIDEYDWTEIFRRSDNGNIPPLQEDCSVLYSYKSEPQEPNFCGIVEVGPGIFPFYYAFSAWTDYTGWGCQDGVEWFGPYPTVNEALGHLTQADRRSLGLEDDATPKGLYRDES